MVPHALAGLAWFLNCEGAEAHAIYNGFVHARVLLGVLCELLLKPGSGRPLPVRPPFACACPTRTAPHMQCVLPVLAPVAAGMVPWT